MSINWFPGHMNKARREIAKALRETDVVIEVLDARLPSASKNPLLAELRGSKPCVVVLNKSDMADPAVTKAWMADLEAEEGVCALALSATRESEARRILKLCRKLVPERGVPGKQVRALVVGIPNVGKSTLINALKGRSVADVSDRPAITRRQQRVDLGGAVVVSDTPGVLWPKIEDPADGYRLAASGAIGDNAMDSLDVALFAATFLAERYPALLRKRFKIDALPDLAELILEEIGKRRGCLSRGVGVDLNKAADLLLHELQTGKIGRVSFEEPAQP